MPLMLEDLKYNKLYRKEIFIPTNLDNRRKLASIVLLTPSHESSVRCMTYSKFLNHRLYTSYYTEKDVNFIVNHETSYMTLERDILQEAELFDNSISKYNRTTISVDDIYGQFPDLDIPDNVTGTAYVFTDSSGRVYGCVVVNMNTLNYLKAVSHKMRFDLLDFAIDTVGVTSIVTDLDSDLLKRAKKEYDFVPSRGKWLVRNVFKGLNESTTNYKKISLTSKSVSKYKQSAKYLSHFRTEKDGAYDGYIWLDKDTVVAACSVDTSRGIIQAIEISKEYKGQRLSYDILKSCVNLGGRKLTVAKNNSIAKHVYDKFGFRVSNVTDNQYEMALSESTAVLTESVSLIDAEIKIWQAQIAITEEIIKFFGDESWIRSKFNSMKSKLIKIPIDGYHNSLVSLDDLKAHLENQKITLEFYTHMKALELKDQYDLSDIVDEYTYWVKALKCPKSLKVKILKRTISSYKKTIKEYEKALSDYEKMSIAGRRIENLKALVSKTFSIFGFLTGGPLSPIKGILLKSILPKSSKKSILSDDELEAKIRTYKKIVEVLENELQETQALNEEAYIAEGKLSSKDRNDLPDSEFGIPHKRKYPLNDKNHILSAVRMFNHVDRGDEEVLAKNIQRKAKELGVELSVSPDNKLYRYLEESFQELASWVMPLREDFIINESSISSKDYMTIFESSITEDAKYDTAIRKMIYQDRIKNHQELLHYYDRVKEDCPFITRTFLDYKKYAGYNLFIDMSYYMQSFIKHNYFKLDKGIRIMSDFISRFLDDKRLDSLGYKKKTIFIPIHDWEVKEDTLLWDYTNNINPISIIYRILKQGKETTKFKESWGKSDFVFLGDYGYFKINLKNFDKKDLPRFLMNIKSLLNHERIDDLDEPDTSKIGIVASIVDKLENNSGDKIEINNLVGSAARTDTIKKDDKKISSDDIPKNDREKKKDELEAELVDNIKNIADKAESDVDIEKELDKDSELKGMIVDLMSYNSIDISPTRAARISQLNNKFLDQTIKDVPVSALISDYQDKPLDPVSLPIETINDDWKYITSTSFNKSYNINSDISKCIYHFGNCTVPVSVISVNVEDNTTSEDSIETWTVKCEDAYGKRFTLKFDIPKIIDNRFMKLRGNMKTISGQLMNLPIIKTARDTCQITSNYNKIFIRTFNTSSGKSNAVAARIIKTLLKLKESKSRNYEIELGDMTLISNKYELPLDYIDIGSKISKVTYMDTSKSKITLYFNQDEFMEKYGDKINLKKGSLAFVTVSDKNNNEDIVYPDNSSNTIAEFCRHMLSGEEFNSVYEKTTQPVKSTYSKARIMSTEIPVAVLLCYALGLTAALKRMQVEYSIEDKRPSYNKDRQDCIRLSDCWIVYENTYLASMILNGLKECDMAGYTLVECNTKKMWLDQLDLFGGRIKADGLDMFYDLMFDPITVEICHKYKIPDNYCDALIYASHLLSDIKYNRHSDITGNRLRNMEIIAGYTYKVLATSYSSYRRELKAGRDASMSVKRTAVIDAILVDNTCSDLSILSPLLEVESANTVSFKGLSGMNTDRAYGLAERIYSDSMVNVLAMSTGFSANVGISRQTTIDMSVDTARGYIKPSDSKEMGIAKSFCMTEALTPYGATSDDPFRTAMTYIQTSKHGMITTISDPLLVTNGADQAIVYMTSDTFAHKAKNSGVVKELTDEYMVLEYKSGDTEVVDLRETMMKNSDGGMWVPVELSPKLKEGGHFKENDIVAVDSRTYSKIGITDNYSYNIGTFCKFAMICSETGYEDACIHTKWLSKALSSKVVDQKQYIFPKNTNVYEMVKKGQTVQEGEPLIIFQNSFDEDDANDLIRMLTNADEKAVSELGRIPIRSNITGVIDDIRIYRCVELDELSPSLKKIVSSYEKEITKFNKVLDKYDKEKAKSAPATYKLESTGKLKNCEDSIMIEFYISYLDEFSPADKIVNYSALKGVSSKQIKEGLECKSKYRPDETIHYLQSDVGDMHRMVGSVLKIGALNKVLVETARHACDIMGIKWKYFDEYDS